MASGTPRIRRVLRGAVRVFGSFGLACVLLVLLALLTLFGTLEQAERSLYDVQREYFGSAFVVHRVAGVVPIVLPGAYLLLALLFANLLVGGLLRIRKSRATLGVLVTHVGIALLLVGGFVEDRWAVRGTLTLQQGEGASAFVSEDAWEIAITEYLPEGGVREFVIPDEHFAHLGVHGSVRMVSPDLPFDVLLSEYVEDARPPRRLDPRLAPYEGAEGFALQSVAAGTEGAIQTPGLCVTLVERRGDRTRHRGLLWALQRYPYSTEIDGRRWDVDLRLRRYDLPFELVLDRFVHEEHPGTAVARRFSSYVRRIEDGVAQDAHITMNEPLRHGGYVFFQHDWGPRDGAPGQAVFSIFAVVENPSDRIPLIACIVIALGLIVHWVRKLVLHLRRAVPARPRVEPAE